MTRRRNYRIQKGGIVVTGICLFLSLFSKAGFSQTLPIPSPENAFIISIEHEPRDSAEVDYIKQNLPFGLYAWLSFSVTTLTPSLSWHIKPADADAGIQGFKDQVNSLLAAVLQKNVRLHLVLTSGLARHLVEYKEAKQEDIRNGQWYNDNKLAGDDQIARSTSMDQYIFGTLSRYARKLRAHLEAKAKASLAFLKRAMADNPGTLIALSGWGEAELNYNRINNSQSIQDRFCDYSPFAVLEFKDWIRHAGEYDDQTGKYKGQGYPQGGLKYQNESGLSQFNTDFGTNFSSWELKYYNWSLADDFDSSPEDDINNDPHLIPYSAYSHGNMMPESGPNYIEGGFDPPRTMTPGKKYWDLWNLFRETMVAHFVKDMARWASEAGISANRWFSHQIPADYLYGTSPDTPDKNARYYTSASPLWTADVLPYGSAGATIYDIKFPGWFVRTTDNILPAISMLSSNWAAMEYDPETYPEGFDVAESSPDFILDQYMRIYGFAPSLINFWRWWDETGEHRIKGKNKEIALGRFVQRIRDKARSKDLSVVYEPPQVIGLQGEFQTQEPAAVLQLSGKIWAGESWEWKQWGDFSRFDIFKGTDAGFPADAAHLLGTTTEYTYKDTAVIVGRSYYYKIRALNINHAAGPLSAEIKLPTYALVLSAGSGGTTDPPPGIYLYDPNSAVTIRAIPDDKYDFSHWSGDVNSTENPLTVNLDSSKSIKANFQKGGAYPPLNFTGNKIVNRSLTQAEMNIVLRWESNPKNKDIVRYKIYIVEGQAQRLVSEPPPDATEYRRRGVSKEKEYIFAITAVSGDNVESQPAVVTIK